MDRTDLEQMLGQLNAEREALESRLTVVARAADGLQALLEMTPATIVGWTPVVDPGAVVAGAVSAGEARRAAPARRRRAKATPRGKEAAELILRSDTSRHWNVREVSDEEVKRGWAKPRPRGAKGNPPARIALQRLHEEYPLNVEVITEPVLAYKWVPYASPSPNGSGESRVEEEAAERAP